MQLNEDQIVEVEIDLNELKKNQLDESFMVMFASMAKMLLNFLTAPVHNYPNFKIKGSRKDVESFARTLGREKRYLESLKKSGLDNPKTFKSKSALDKAVKKFENTTGLKWPFK